MDPVSRREVWDIIERAKKGRVVILTTHSMEEADTLADTIGTAFSPTIHRQQPNNNQHNTQRCSYHGQGSAAVYGLGYPLEEEVRSRTSLPPPLPSILGPKKLLLVSVPDPQGYQITVAVKRESRGAVTEFFESQIEGA